MPAPIVLLSQLPDYPNSPDARARARAKMIYINPASRAGCIDLNIAFLLLLGLFFIGGLLVSLLMVLAVRYSSPFPSGVF